MSVITEGMTPAEYLSAINSKMFSVSNAFDLNDLSGVTISTLNQNFDIYCKAYSQVNQQLVAGERSLTNFNKMNGNFELIKDGTDLALKPLVENGTFTPATESNSLLAKYKNFKLGGLISFSMYTFNYSWTKPYNPYLFNLTNIDVATWVSQAAAAGIEYLALSILDNSGFSLFDNPITVPDKLLNQTYGYKKCDVALVGADTQIIDKFMTACLANGIEPVLYFCTTQLTTAYYKKPQRTTITFTQYDESSRAAFDNYFAKVFQYVLTTWGPKYMWLDVAGTGTNPVNAMQVYYDAIKSIDTSCQVIGNSIGDLPFDWFPYDIGSNEELFSGVNGTTKTWAQVLATARTNGVTEYYVPQEYCTNIFAAGGDGRWYWNNQALKNQATVQASYDIAKANSSPYLMCLAPNTSGVIPQAQFDLFANINL